MSNSSSELIIENAHMNKPKKSCKAKKKKEQKQCNEKEDIATPLPKFDASSTPFRRRTRSMSNSSCEELVNAEKEGVRRSSRKKRTSSFASTDITENKKKIAKSNTLNDEDELNNSNPPSSELRGATPRRRSMSVAQTETPLQSSKSIKKKSNTVRRSTRKKSVMATPN